MLPTIDRELSKNTTWLANQYISFLLTVTSPRICFQIWIQLLVLRKSKAADPSSGQFLQATTDDGVSGHLFLCRKTSKKTAVLLYSSYSTTCWGVAKVGTGYASITCIRWPNRTVSVKAYCSEGVAPQGQLYYSTVLSRSSRLHAWGVHLARSIKKQEAPGWAEDAQLPRYTLMFHPAFVIFSLVFW